MATDGKRIFACFGGAGLFCLDFAGEKLWHAELGDLDHMWGTAASPILYGKTVIQLCDAAKGSYVAAFDQATGQEVWHTPRSSSGCWSTPALAEVDVEGVSRTELIVNGGATDDAGQWLVVGYNPDDGAELWRVAGTTQLVTPAPLVAGGLVYSTSGRNGAIMAIRPGGSGDVTASRVVWKRSRGGPIFPRAWSIATGCSCSPIPEG